MIVGQLPVLIIEDDKDMRETLAEVLAQEDFAVETAASAEQALARLQSGGVNPCLLLLDLLMPGTTGWELLNEIGRDPQLAAIPVIVLTGLDDPHLPPEIAVLRKPIAASTLLEAIRDFSPRLRDGSAAVLR